MRFAVDAHAIGRHLTGNEVYVRSLLNGFAALDRESDFITYLSMEDAEAWVPSRFPVRRIAGNPFIRLGCDLSLKLRRDLPQLLHVQYTAPLACPVPSEKMRMLRPVNGGKLLKCARNSWRTGDAIAALKASRESKATSLPIM